MIVKAIWNECAIALFCHGKKPLLHIHWKLPTKSFD